MTAKLNYIDLFAGAGGLSEGFIKAGFNPIAHVEMDEAACYTLKTRVAYHHLKNEGQFDKYLAYLKGEINREELYNLIPAEKLESVINLPIGEEYNKAIFEQIDNQVNSKSIDLIVGGPPCQAYSLVGRARDANGMKNDPRNHLYLDYAKFLKRYQPKIFVFENVMGLLSANKGIYYQNMLEKFGELGYTVNDIVVHADRFGVLQKRKRILLIGHKRELKLTIPEIKGEENTSFLVENIFSDLPELQAGEGKDKYVKYKTKTNKYLNEAGIRNGIDVLTQHVARPHREQDKKIYSIAVELWNEQSIRLDYNNLPKKLKTHKNRTSFIDRFKVVAAKSTYAHTVVAHISKDGHYYIHPDIKQNRSISVREAARLQSFPDDFYFEGVKEGANRTAAYKQIGNAVPPLMGYKIACIIKNLYGV